MGLQWHQSALTRTSQDPSNPKNDPTLLSTPNQTLMKLKLTTWTSWASATSNQQANSQCSSQIGYSTLQGAQDLQSALNGGYYSQSAPLGQQWPPTTLVGSPKHQNDLVASQWLHKAHKGTNQPSWDHQFHYLPHSLTRAQISPQWMANASSNSKMPPSLTKDSHKIAIGTITLNNAPKCTISPQWAPNVLF
jgi:hypothetical protein